MLTGGWRRLGRNEWRSVFLLSVTSSTSSLPVQELVAKCNDEGVGVSGSNCCRTARIRQRVKKCISNKDGTYPTIRFQFSFCIYVDDRTFLGATIAIDFDDYSGRRNHDAHVFDCVTVSTRRRAGPYGRACRLLHRGNLCFCGRG
jgi:hypothetical protein